MKKFTFSLLLLFTTYLPLAAQTVAELQETAKTFMRQGDYTNAIVVLKRTYQMAPDNIQLAKDLALCYYFQKDYYNGLQIINPVLDNKNADDQCYQIAGNMYRQQDKLSDCEKLYKKALKRFADSGPLYNDLGEVQLANKNTDAIKTWEKGIEVDPTYSKNYYNAAKFYFYSLDKVWALIYGEIFINMETNTARTAEIKEILLNGYKKLFTDVDIEKANKDKTAFTVQYVQVMNKQASLATSGINTETLTMIRTRFIIDWFNSSNKPAFKLFDLHQQLLKEGMFDAYNQWIFTAADNLSAYENWIKTHPAETTQFLNFQKARTLKMTSDQYYHK